MHFKRKSVISNDPLRTSPALQYPHFLSRAIQPTVDGAATAPRQHSARLFPYASLTTEAAAPQQRSSKCLYPVAFTIRTK
jgi:hypothetical protein